MKKYLFLLFIILNSCTINFEKYFESEKPKKHSPTKVVSVNDTLSLIIDNQEVYIDSLNSIIARQNEIIDSLQIRLEYSEKRVAVNDEFVIPDSIVFAGRTFDLRNERLRHKFTEIYKKELRSAHVYIPRSGRYFPLFEEIFKKNDIPDDTKYLSIAESMLNSFAGSSVGAKGIWQFMPKTAKGYGLRINDFIDERMHPVLATEAAVKYIQNAQSYLKRKNVDDYLLALAAYNAGVGGVMKVVKKQESNDFFDLVMRVDETNKYVWRAVAIKMIFENEEEIFGKKFKREKPFYQQFKTAELELKGHYKIDEWATAQGSSIGKVWESNPWIKIYKRSRKRYSAITDIVLPPGKYSVLIPKDAQADMDKIAFYEKEYRKKNSGYFQYHVVKKGDSLWKIASRYNTSISKIKALNNIKSNIIRPGQKLRLHGVVKESKSYTVRSGDTLWEIAQKHNTSIQKIMELNSLQSSNIRPGQKLRVN